MSQRISNYDEYNYEYETYWEGRDYEFASELIVLNKFFSQMKGKRIIDIGGSFGRLLPVYAEKFEEQIIVDYSHKTLSKHSKELITKFPNVRLIAANAYKLPFIENSIDASIMIRVLHHIEDVPSFYKELSRVSNDNSTFIQEFANKIHLKARTNWILHGKFKNLDKSPYQQPSDGDLEGSEKESIFLNFHPSYIKEQQKTVGYELMTKSSSSFMRIPFIKSKFSTKSLVKTERIMQKFFGKTSFAPSIFYKSLLTKENKEDNSTMSFEEILVCPECKNKLKFENKTAECHKCSKEFKLVDNVWDFRVD